MLSNVWTNSVKEISIC